MLPAVCAAASVLTSSDAVAMQACFMPNIDFHFPARGARLC